MLRRAWAEIDLAAIRANIAALKTSMGTGVQVMAVLKADAYGHGAQRVAKTVLSAGAVWLGVASVDEGIALREADIHAPILLLCPCAPDEAGDLLSYDLTPTVGNTEFLRALIRESQRFQTSPEIHLEIDTGIGRSGALPEQAVALWQKAVAGGLRVTGLSTHFSDAENPDSTFTKSQIQSFQGARTALAEAGATFSWVHLSNSAGVLHFGAADGNLVRPGLLMYGIFPPTLPSRKDKNGELDSSFILHPSSLLGLSPVLTLKASVASVRELPAGHPISYGMTHRLTRPSRVATVLIGYGDGYSRRLSNRGEMLICGRRAKILGRVCMDQTVVDVTDIPDAGPGAEAVCIGVQGDERVTVEEIARLIETTEHDVTTPLTNRVERCY